MKRLKTGIKRLRSTFGRAIRYGRIPSMRLEPPFLKIIRRGAACVWVVCFCTFSSCRHTPESEAAGEAISFRHATLINALRTDSFTAVDILDPWHEGKVAARYVLVPRGQAVPREKPAGTVVTVPLERAVAFSSVHAALADDLGCINRVCGVCDTEYICSPTLRDAVASKRLADFGAALQPAVERIVAAKADALFVSPFRDQVPGPAESLGIPVVACADYMETSPLGRAEWMRFYGMLLGCEARADSLFTEIEARYELWKARAATANARPTLMVDLRTGPVWYTAGGRSTMGALYADAGLHYLFADDTVSGSVAKTFEQVFDRCREADYWFVKYGRAQDHTYSSLAADDARYKRFRPWQTRHIVGCNTLLTPFYEETPFRPDRLIAEFVQTFHPELQQTGFAPRYLVPIAE